MRNIYEKEQHVETTRSSKDGDQVDREKSSRALASGLDS